MTRKLVWLGLSLLLVAAIVLSSCNTTTTTQTTTPTSTQTTATTTKTTTSTTVTTTTATTTKVTTPAVTEPQYGGTLTLYTNASNIDPSGWDTPMAINLGNAAVWANPYLEWLVCGDVEKYGPGGTNQFAFNLYEAVPEQYYSGQLATSWDIQTTPAITYTFHIRQGVMWTGNQKIGMAPRELTAADVASSQNRAMTRPGFASSLTWIKSIVATDKYTLVWTLNTPYANWAWRMGGTAIGAIQAPETVAAGATDWRNHTGTGAFILTDYVSGSGVTYTRNPAYWGTTTINGKQYKEPFIDRLIYPIIADTSTQIAAVRTGKLDWDPKVAMTYQANLTSSAPALIQQKYLSGTVEMVKFNRLTSKYFQDKNLRRAIMIGTDLKAIGTMVYNSDQYYSWPLAPLVPGFTPQDQLPAAAKELWTYDTAKAKQLIAAAGYPNGFTVDLTVGPVQTQQDVANALAGMWAKIGVTANIKSVDATALSTLYNDVTYKDFIVYNFSVNNPYTTLILTRSGGAGGIYKADEPYYGLYNTLLATVDVTQRQAMVKDLALQFMDDVGCMGFANPYYLNAYWPWMKNYYGEIDSTYYNQIPMVKRLWIDKNLKASLGK